MKQGKIWGHTQELFNKNNVSIHRIQINKGSTCSEHYHDYKYNMFYVEQGKLLIRHWQNNCNNLIDETVLLTNESCIIPPKHFHQFVALEDTIAYEIYYVQLIDEDIYRRTCGTK